MPATLLIPRAGAIPRVLDGDSGREARREQPAAPVAADAEAAPRVRAVEVASSSPLAPVSMTVTARGGGAPGRGQRRGGGEHGLLHLAVLLDELARDDAEHLLDALAALGADLVARVPAHLLPPEPAAPLATRAAGLRRARRRGAAAEPYRAGDHRGRRPGRRRVRLRYRGAAARGQGEAVQARGDGRGRGRRAEAGGEVLGDVGDAALEGDLAARGVAGDDVGLGADDVQHDIGGQVAAQLGQPHAHLGEGVGVGDAVAEDAGVGTAVVKSRDRAESFLAG